MDKLLTKSDITKAPINANYRNTSGLTQAILKEEKKETNSDQKSIETGSKEEEEGDPLFTPFSTRTPFNRWQGQSSTILQLSITDDTYWWVYYDFEDPKNFQSFFSQSEAKNEIIFFSKKTQKYFRVANDCLYWAYYANGPFQRIEGGVWLAPTDKADLEANVKIITGKDKKKYELNFNTGLLKELDSEKSEEEEEEEDEDEDEDENKDEDKDKDQEKENDKNKNKGDKESSTNELQAQLPSGIYKTFSGLKDKNANPKNATQDKDAFDKIQPFLEKVSKNSDFEVWKDALIAKEDGSDQKIPLIKSTIIMKTFEEITEIYEITYDLLRETKNLTGIVYFPLDSRDDLKFIVGVILFELCLYPKTYLQSIPPILFCSNISSSSTEELPFNFYRNGKIEYMALSCKTRNLIKIQKGIHQNIFTKHYPKIKTDIPEFENSWRELNPQYFQYDNKRKKVPKGQTGFLTFTSTLSLECDTSEIYFAMMKDPDTILNHQDRIIAKKGFLLKNALEALFPDSITGSWWEKVKNYKDIIETARGSTDYFKEAQLDEEQVK